MKEEFKQDKTYSIGEVSQLLSVKEHTIRFWEKEFPFLNPPKNLKGRRVYRLEDIKLLQKIKKLLYNDGYTTKGALKELEKDARPPIEIQTEPQKIKQEETQEKKKSLEDNNIQALTKNQNRGEGLYKKISHEILYRIYHEIDELITFWKGFPDERK